MNESDDKKRNDSTILDDTPVSSYPKQQAESSRGRHSECSLFKKACCSVPLYRAHRQSLSLSYRDIGQKFVVDRETTKKQNRFITASLAAKRVWTTLFGMFSPTSSLQRQDDQVDTNAVKCKRRNILSVQSRGVVRVCSKRREVYNK
jgi:hypothetical protein